jgi:hypothetical protein
MKGEGYLNTLHFILPNNIDLLPEQITEVNYRLIPLEGANSVCGYFLCGDHRREITTAQGNHNGCGEV